MLVFTYGVVRVSQFAGHKQLGYLPFSLESGNFLDHLLLINSASCLSTVGPDSPALTKSSAISDNNGSLMASACLSQAHGFVGGVSSWSVSQRACISASESSFSFSELLLSFLEPCFLFLGLGPSLSPVWLE